MLGNGTRRGPIARPAMCLGLLWLCTVGIGACTSAKVEETHYFAAYGSRGETNFYRVRIEAESRNSKAKFQAGEFPADAVDAVFGEVSAEGDPQAEVDALRKAVTKTARRYGDLLAAADSKEDDVDKASERYQQAIEALQRRSDGRPGFDVAKKFVFVFSTDPGDVIRAIQDYLKQQDFSKTLANLFQGSVVEEAMLAEENYKLLEQTRKARSSVLSQTTASIGTVNLKLADPAQATSADVVGLASRVQDLANGIDLAAQAMPR